MRLTRWDQELSSSSTSEILRSIGLTLADEIVDDTARHRCRAALMGDVRDVVALSPDYARLSPNDSYLVRQIHAFFGKRGDIDLGVDRREVAVRKFLGTEELCAQTNDIFRKRALGNFSFPNRVEAQLFRAQRKVAFILGDVPSLSDMKFRFGPGASTTLPKKNGGPPV